MTLQKESNCICPLGGVMDIISKKWALLVINTIGNSQKIRYSEVRDILGDINSKVLSDRLKEFEEYRVNSNSIMETISSNRFLLKINARGADIPISDCPT